MIIFRSALIGLGTIVLGCVITSVGLVIWATGKVSSGVSIGFSPINVAHSVGFWVFILVLFLLGFVPSLLLRRK